MPRIMIDAGHYGLYNRSPAVPEYYESKMTWALHLKLIAELKKYGIECGTTRSDQTKDMPVYERGTKAKGYDMFISLHSNAVGSGVNESVDRPVVIHMIEDKDGAKFSKTVADMIHETMKTNQAGKVDTRVLDSGRNYYGVLRGAAAVGCPHGFIIEHSFHTATTPSKWLLQDSNLQIIAEKEAKIIADFFNVQKKEDSDVKNVQKATFDIDTLVVTQGMNGSFSHKGVLALDIGAACKYLKAPFDGTIKKKYYYDNEIWLESDNKVQYADGTVDYMTMLVMHCNDTSANYVGQKIKKGEIFYYPGVAGRATGSHIHITVGKGKFTGGGWYQNSDGNWCITNQYDITKALYISPTVKVSNGGGYQWKRIIESEDDDMTVEEVKKIVNEAVKSRDTKIASLEEKVASLENQNRVYKYWTEIKEIGRRDGAEYGWAYPPLWAMYKAGLFSGANASDLNVTMHEIRAVVYIANMLKKEGRLSY